MTINEGRGTCSRLDLRHYTFAWITAGLIMIMIGLRRGTLAAWSMQRAMDRKGREEASERAGGSTWTYHCSPLLVSTPGMCTLSCIESLAFNLVSSRDSNRRPGAPVRSPLLDRHDKRIRGLS